MNPVIDPQLAAMLKTVYLSGVYNNKYQNSPILHDIKKEKAVWGKEIKYAAQYGNGGNFGSNYGQIAVNPTQGVSNLEWTMELGYLFGLFDINQPEQLTSAEERGAYMSILANKMAGCFDGLSKTLATYLYGGVAGVIDQVKSGITLASTGNELEITSAGAIKLDLGSRFVIATAGADNAAVPKSPLLSAICTVTSIDGNKITFDASASGEQVFVGDYIELYTARTGNKYTGIEGLADILPSIAERSGTDWENYIKTDFRGVDRSKAVERLAGQFATSSKFASSDTPKQDALLDLLKRTKRAGGINDIVILNDETWYEVAKEGNITNWQNVDAAKADKTSKTVGFNNIGLAFEDAFMNRVVADPYATYGVGYMLDMDDLRFYDLGNVSKVLDPVANDSLGKHDIESVGKQGFGDVIDSKINLDKLFNVVPATVAANDANIYGPSMVLSANIYGNFQLRKTAGSGVVVLK